jgi:Leucine-rich repeat (LRR) protein
VFGGLHQVGRSNADVGELFIQGSNVPFIIPQSFSTFPNLQTYRTQISALTRIQENALSSSAGRLTNIRFDNELKLTTIPSNAFFSASNLSAIEITNSRVETIDENAFNGLAALRTVFFNFNAIRDLPLNVFAQLPTLSSAFFSNNQFTSFDGRLFANNPRIGTIGFANNFINSVQRGFVGFIPRIQHFNMLGNVCVNRLWSISNDPTTNNPVTITTIRRDLETCFVNAENSD